MTGGQQVSGVWNDSDRLWSVHLFSDQLRLIGQLDLWAFLCQEEEELWLKGVTDQIYHQGNSQHDDAARDISIILSLCVCVSFLRLVT